MKPSNVVIIGTGRFACACLEACLVKTKNIVCVEPENPGFPTLRSMCIKRSIKYNCLLERDKLTDFFGGISSPTLVVSAYNSFMFPKAVLANRSLRIINFHNSLLPRHRGRNAPTFTIFEMDAVTGITWHLVSAEIDKGEIICQRVMAVPADINAIDLTRKTLELGAAAFQEILPSLLDGNYGFKSSGDPSEETFHLSTDVPNGGILDLGWSLPKAHAFLRSLDYGNLKVFPPAQIQFLGSHFSVLKYAVKHDESGTSQGTTIETHNGQLVLRDGAMYLTIDCRKT